MKILDRYIAITVLNAIALVTLMLVGLQLFILFVDQFGDLGRMDYGIVQATWFVLLQLPYQVYLFFPIASLLGSLIGLGVLANHSELIVMRSAGMSIMQVTSAVFRVALLLVIFVSIFGELLVPFLSQYANNYKTMAISGGQTLRTSKGFWMRHHNDFISVKSVEPNSVLSGVNQFHFNKQHQLLFARYIDKVQYAATGWIAYDVQQTNFLGDHLHSKTFATMPWEISVKPKLLAISSIEPDEMSLRELRRYIREQKHTHQNTHIYQIAFLQRIVQPFTTMVMMILAIPFIFGPLRSSTVGAKLVIGAVIGFSFHILNRFFGPMSTVYQLPPELAALGPTVLFAGLGLYLMSKMR